MKDWRIHFGWTIVTILASVVSARLAAPPEPAPPPRVARPAPLVSPGAAEASADERPKPETPGPAAAVPDDPPAKAVAEEPLPARLRAVLKSQNAWQDLQTLAADLAHRDATLDALKDLLNDPDFQVKFNAITALRLMKGREAARILEAFLLRHLDSENGEASSAAAALGEMGDLSSMPALNEALRAKNEETRLSAAQALSQLGFGGPAGDIVAAMTRQFESPDGAMRRKAIEQISRLDPQGSAPLLLRALRDSNGDVRLQAVWTVQGLGRPEYLPFIQALQNDPNPEVAQAAKEAEQTLKGDDK
ncbi:MAG: HEAT repeat domain-containing protein [Planctomycetaceae bacterium]|nr:HEAT repeat domain-containing protein [Planctomycetaceae bacterium]